MVDIVLTKTNNIDQTNNEKAFKQDVLFGLNQLQKSLPSKYLYDEQGSEIFNQITRHPDYYLTRCELEILTNHAEKISKLIGDEAFNLIELGPGEGIKTLILINAFMRQYKNFTYIPIDISAKYLELFTQQLLQQQAKLNIKAIQADYADGLLWLKKYKSKHNLVLFLGSSIGNFDLPSTKQFLLTLKQNLQADDYVLIGFDLKKPISILRRAYDDQDGLTKAFNLNLLRRINDELGGHFDPNKFYHYATYNVYTGAMESYLISLMKQSVAVDALHKKIEFDAFEAIHVEYSYKYLLSQIAELATFAGFEIVAQFQDARHYFVDSLWRIKK